MVNSLSNLKYYCPATYQVSLCCPFSTSWLKYSILLSTHSFYSLSMRLLGTRVSFTPFMNRIGTFIFPIFDRESQLPEVSSQANGQMYFTIGRFLATSQILVKVFYRISPLTLYENSGSESTAMLAAPPKLFPMTNNGLFSFSAMSMLLLRIAFESVMIQFQVGLLFPSLSENPRQATMMTLLLLFSINDSIKNSLFPISKHGTTCTARIFMVIEHYILCLFVLYIPASQGQIITCRDLQLFRVQSFFARVSISVSILVIMSSRNIFVQRMITWMHNQQIMIMPEKRESHSDNESGC